MIYYEIEGLIARNVKKMVIGVTLEGSEAWGADTSTDISLFLGTLSGYLDPFFPSHFLLVFTHEKSVTCRENIANNFILLLKIHANIGIKYFIIVKIKIN